MQGLYLYWPHGNLLLIVQILWSFMWRSKELRSLTRKEKDKLENEDADESKEMALTQKTPPEIPSGIHQG